jgi:hypothetical protein
MGDSESMKSYVKIYGPPLLMALKALEKLSIDMPEVCIMDTLIDQSVPQIGTTYNYQEFARTYFGATEAINLERCSKIISRSGETMGEYDFYFEWFKPPTASQVEDLIKKIDEALKPVGVKYTITTK